MRKVNALWGRQGLSLNQGWVDLHVMQWLLNKNGIDDDTTIQGGEGCITSNYLNGLVVGIHQMVLDAYLSLGHDRWNWG